MQCSNSLRVSEAYCAPHLDVEHGVAAEDGVEGGVRKVLLRAVRHLELHVRAQAHRPGQGQRHLKPLASVSLLEMLRYIT